jgi:hypothetical protein
MNGTTIVIVTVMVALVLVLGGGLVFYMSNLVKSAYDLKIALNSELDEKIRKIEEDMEKKSRWIKKELIDEVEKMKTAVQYDSARKIDDVAHNLGRKLTELEEIGRKQQQEAAQVGEELRNAISVLDQKLNVLRRDQKKADAKAEAAAAAPAPPPVGPSPLDLAPETAMAEPA